MSALELPRLTGTGSIANLRSAHWPYSDHTGAVVLVPEIECEFTGIFVRNKPEAEHLVRSIQEILGMTIGQIGRALDCSRQAVHGWMRGRVVDPRNLANLQVLSEHAKAWKELGKARPSSLCWTESLLSGFAAAGLDSEAGRTAWNAFVAEQEEVTRRRSRIPTVAELDRMLGSKPSSLLKNSQRLADNLRSLRRDARSGR